MATMNKVIEYVDRVKPNVYTDADKYKWLKLLEDKIIREVMGEEGECSVPEDADSELTVKSPYEEIYELYVMAMIDFHNKEYDDYNNTILRFREVYDQYVSWYIRHNSGSGANNFRNVMG
jgi:hypothetical protein